MSSNPAIPPPNPEPQIVGRPCAPDQLGEIVVEFSEVQPELTGGLAAFQARLVYPAEDRRAGTEGTVVVAFVVGLDGRACDASIRRSLKPGLDRAAVTALEESTFSAARQDGRPCAARMLLPARFSLQE